MRASSLLGCGGVSVAVLFRPGKGDLPHRASETGRPALLTVVFPNHGLSPFRRSDLTDVVEVIFPLMWGCVNPRIQDLQPGGRGSFGSPRTRSPTMFRWISAVPPQMVSDRLKKKLAWSGLTG